MKKQMKKLVLAKETLYDLRSSDARRVAAGEQPTFAYRTCICPQTEFTCPDQTCLCPETINGCHSASCFC